MDLLENDQALMSYVSSPYFFTLSEYNYNNISDPEPA